jgi:hypothetical protein
MGAVVIQCGWVVHFLSHMLCLAFWLAAPLAGRGLIADRQDAVQVKYYFAALPCHRQLHT